MSEEMPTPMVDELAAKLPVIPWSGNETDAVRNAVYGALAAWLGLARELERNMRALQAGVLAANVLGPEHRADDGDARPKSHGPGPDVIGTVRAPARTAEEAHRQGAAFINPVVPALLRPKKKKRR